MNRHRAELWRTEDTRPPFKFGCRVQLTHWSRLWTIGNRVLLDQPLLALFCSKRCPGATILRTLDLVKELRDSGIAVMSGFHSPIEKECLTLLLRGKQPVVICPARSIETLRLPKAWTTPVDRERLLIASPFPASSPRITAELARKRNDFIAEAASAAVFAHVETGGITAQVLNDLVMLKKPVWILSQTANGATLGRGVSELKSLDEVTGVFLSAQPAPLDASAT